jgi:hypothetical protein
MMSNLLKIGVFIIFCITTVTCLSAVQSDTSLLKRKKYDGLTRPWYLNEPFYCVKWEDSNKIYYYDYQEILDSTSLKSFHIWHKNDSFLTTNWIYFDTGFNEFIIVSYQTFVKNNKNKLKSCGLIIDFHHYFMDRNDYYIDTNMIIIYNNKSIFSCITYNNPYDYQNNYSWVYGRNFNCYNKEDTWLNKSNLNNYLYSRPPIIEITDKFDIFNKCAIPKDKVLAIPLSCNYRIKPQDK